MSSIYGYYRTVLEREENPSRYLCYLREWNSIYGQDGEEELGGQNYGIGCYLEHFSQKIRIDKPIIEKDNIVASIDAVIYNRDELINQLSSEIPNDISDEQLLFEWIEDKGIENLVAVNGDFAGVIVKNSNIILFRDHMGIRPLFFCTDKDTLFFSTDIRGIMSLPNIEFPLNEEKFFLEMTGKNYLNINETHFDNIKCVTPGCWLEARYNDGRLEVKETRFWEPGKEKIKRLSDKKYVKILRNLVEDSICRRLEAVTKPVGGELSGGLDSGVIDILISKAGREVQFVSWSRPSDEKAYEENDERLVIQDICEQENKSCTFITKEELEMVNDKVLPPYANTRQISVTSRIVHDLGVKVVFSGHGGDEGVSHRCNVLELWCQGEKIAFLREIYWQMRGKKFRMLRALKKAKYLVDNQLPRLYEPWENKYEDITPFLNKEYHTRMQQTVQNTVAYFAIEPKKYILQGGSRGRLDNAAFQSAEHKVRYMFPFCDYRVIDFALSIPRRMFLKKGVDRYIYREAFKDIMPISLQKVNYKYTPSERCQYDTVLEEYDVPTRIQEAIDSLDKNKWDKYIDFEIIKKECIGEGKIFDNQEKDRAITLESKLYKCLLIQKMQEVNKT